VGLIPLLGAGAVGKPNPVSEFFDQFFEVILALIGIFVFIVILIILVKICKVLILFRRCTRLYNFF